MRRPAVVVRPTSTADVAAVLRFAAEQGVRVAARGAGHSQGGQPLCEGGIVVDVTALSGVEHISPDEQWGQAWAGTTWGTFVRAASAHELVPPVLTSNLDTTLGGTHAAGGFGTTSLHWGAQVNHCLGVELVTGTGDVLWCTHAENRAELTGALGGLGQLGIVTRVRHKLHRLAAFRRNHVLGYTDLEALLGDLARVRISAEVAGAGVTLQHSRGRWVGALLVTEESDTAEHDGLMAVTSDMRPAQRVVGRAMGRGNPAGTAGGVRDHRRYAPGTIRPCLDVLIPMSAATHYCAALLYALEGTMRDRAQVVLLPVARVPQSSVLPALPAQGDVVLVGIYSEVPSAESGPALRLLRRLAERALGVGGTVYPVGSLALDRHMWRTQLGDAWQAWAALQERHDPGGILGSIIA